MDIYLKSLQASGLNKRDSIIEFSPYLTIISGASNTGKTYIFKCIKYILGSDKLEIKTNSGYTSFSLVICKNGYDIKFTRKIKSNDVSVSSEYETIESGLYSTDNEKENNINSVYLRLFNIEEDFKVPFNKNCVMKRFTLRMFLHMLMINEKEIERDLSIILPKEKINKTYFLSHLLYLLYETDFSSYDPDDSEVNKKIKKAAVSKYINEKIFKLKEQIENLKNNSILNSNYNPNDELKSLNLELKNIEDQLHNTCTNGQYLLKEITEKSEKLNEALMLLNRYSSLESQFTSDIERLTFISECHHSILIENNIFNTNFQDIKNSPFLELTDSTIDAEILRITSQLDGLLEIKKTISNEIDELNTSISQLKTEKDKADKIINQVLKPAQKNIEEKIDTFQKYITTQEQLKIIESVNNQYEGDLTNLYKKSPRKNTYSPIELFSEKFEDEITVDIQSILKLCGHPKYNTASFSLRNFDIEINGNSKASNGKGFTAFYNTIMILSIRKYLYDNARIKPFFYIIDTPLLGLDVGHTHINKNNLIKGIYNYFLTSMDQSQMIIIDNEKDMPTIELNDSKIKYYNFTHDEDEGRYGFLFDFRD